MPAVPEWDVLLRGGVLRALSPRGCRSGWTVSNFRGRARLHITARAAGGHRRQLLLPYPWESDQLEAIRDGVVKLYADFQEGIPLEQAIAELSAAIPAAQTAQRRNQGIDLGAAGQAADGAASENSERTSESAGRQALAGSPG